MCLRKAKRYDEAEVVLRQALKIKKAKLGKDDLRFAFSLHELDVCLRDAERYAEAGEVFRQTLDTPKTNLDRDCF